MASDLGLVAQAAERHTGVFAPRGVGYRASQRGLAHSRRAVEAEDRRLHVVAELHHRHVLHDALLHFLQPVVVALQCLLHIVDGEVGVGILAPGKAEHRVEIGVLQSVFRIAYVEAAELLELLAEMGRRLLAPLHLGGALLKLVGVGLFAHAVAELVADVADLHLEKLLLLLARQLLACAHRDVGLKLQFLKAAVEVFQEDAGPLLEGRRLEHIYLLRHVERRVERLEAHVELRIAFKLLQGVEKVGALVVGKIRHYAVIDV